MKRYTLPKVQTTLNRVLTHRKTLCAHQLAIQKNHIYLYTEVIIKCNKFSTLHHSYHTNM